MDVYKKLIIPRVGHTDRTIYFGIAHSENEKAEAYRLRFNVYKERGYIDANRYPQGEEVDMFDEPGKSVLFVAAIEGQIIGCIRLITTAPLPTEHYFDFDEPQEINVIPPHQRGELGRFVIIPPDRRNGDFLPKGLVMLFMLDTVAHYGLTHTIAGGYAFIKKSLETKMRRLGVPFKKINTYREHYPPEGVLYNYFSQADNPVVPVYFLTQECAHFTEKKISHPLFFKHISPTTVRLRTPRLFSFLQKIKIL